MNSLYIMQYQGRDALKKAYRTSWSLMWKLYPPIIQNALALQGNASPAPTCPNLRQLQQQEAQDENKPRYLPAGDPIDKPVHQKREQWLNLEMGPSQMFTILSKSSTNRLSRVTNDEGLQRFCFGTLFQAISLGKDFVFLAITIWKRSSALSKQFSYRPINFANTPRKP